jgi:ERCC4-related helicase
VRVNEQRRRGVRRVKVILILGFALGVISMDVFGKPYVSDPLIWPETVEARLYQQTIAAAAHQKNTMVILPTALGKTIISALVAAHFLSNHWDKRVLVMAPTRPLILQHRETFLTFLRISTEDVKVLTGKVPPHLRKQLWQGESRVFFATPQIVRNDLDRGRLVLENFSLLVFDECHRARKNYAYTHVARKYVEQSPWPMIMATTASPGSNQRTIQEICGNLYVEQIEFRTEEDADVEPYIHPVDTEWRQVDLSPEYTRMAHLLRTILMKRLKRLQSLGVVNKRLDYVSRRDLLQAGENLRRRLGQTTEEERGPLLGAIMLQAASLTTFHALELVETQGIYSLRRFLEKIEANSHLKKSYKNVVSDAHYHLLRAYLTNCRGLKHPKVLALREEVRQHLEESPSSRILVFTQYRDTATHLVTELRNLNNVNVERFVGQASKEKDPGLSQDEQAHILQRFREGELNVLVATSIAEEGLDIPAVDLVIFYEPIPSGIRYIQRKGRTGRKTAGKTVILAANETSDIAYLYASRHRVAKMKTIVANLNQQLSLLSRRGVRPPRERIPLSKIADEKPLIEPNESRNIVAEEIRAFTKEVDRTAKILWMKIMKAGTAGFLIEDLEEASILEGYSPTIVEAALHHLEEANQIYRPGGDRFASLASMTADDEKPNTVYEVEIEKVLPGRATCVINGQWKACLVPEEYEGPPHLIRKNMRFKAKGTLHREKETLYLHVQSVTEVL